MAQRGGLQPLVCLNKADLALAGAAGTVAAVYQNLGYPVCVVSAHTGQGMEALQARLTDRDSVLVGQSGVGKSSLLNRLEPGLQVRTQELMRLHQRGRHTTAGVQLYPLAGGGNIIDTPGIKELRLWDVSADELVGYFAEMADLASQCRFRDCTHVGEPGCAILAAVDAGTISRARHEGYARIHQSL
jgi:ribosome biogenesis GTPase